MNKLMFLSLGYSMFSSYCNYIRRHHPVHGLDFLFRLYIWIGIMEKSFMASKPSYITPTVNNGLKHFRPLDAAHNPSSCVLFLFNFTMDNDLVTLLMTPSLISLSSAYGLSSHETLKFTGYIRV
jgi:hypothetical protein